MTRPTITGHMGTNYTVLHKRLSGIEYLHSFIFIYFFIYLLRLYSTSAEGPGPTACLQLLQKVCLKMWRKEKKNP